MAIIRNIGKAVLSRARGAGDAYLSHFGMVGRFASRGLGLNEQSSALKKLQQGKLTNQDTLAKIAQETWKQNTIFCQKFNQAINDDFTKLQSQIDASSDKIVESIQLAAARLRNMKPVPNRNAKGQFLGGYSWAQQKPQAGTKPTNNGTEDLLESTGGGWLSKKFLKWLRKGKGVAAEDAILAENVAAEDARVAGNVAKTGAEDIAKVGGKGILKTLTGVPLIGGAVAGGIDYYENRNLGHALATGAGTEVGSLLGSAGGPVGEFGGAFAGAIAGGKLYNWLMGKAHSGQTQKLKFHKITYDIKKQIKFTAKEITFPGVSSGTSQKGMLSSFLGMALGSGVRSQYGAAAYGTDQGVRSEYSGGGGGYGVGTGARSQYGGSPYGIGGAGKGGGGGGGGGPQNRVSRDGQVADKSGRKVDAQTLDHIRDLMKQHKGQAEIYSYIRGQGYNVDSAWCGDLASALVSGAGFRPPPGSPIASSWHLWGEKISPEDVNKGHPFGSMVATYYHGRYGGMQGRELAPGQTGGHVMTIVPGSYDPKTNTVMVDDTYGQRRVSTNDLDFRYAGDKAVAIATATPAGQTPGKPSDLPQGVTDNGPSMYRGKNNGNDLYPRQGDVKAAIKDQLVKEGVSPQAAEIGANALMGQAIAESGLKNEWHDAGKTYGAAGGYVQSIYGADKNRGQAMYSWLKAHGYSPDDTSAQGRWMAHEAMTSYPNVKRQLLNANEQNKDALADVLTQEYESPASRDSYHTLQERRNNAAYAATIPLIQQKQQLTAADPSATAVPFMQNPFAATPLPKAAPPPPTPPPPPRPDPPRITIPLDPLNSINSDGPKDNTSHTEEQEKSHMFDGIGIRGDIPTKNDVAQNFSFTQMMGESQVNA